MADLHWRRAGALAWERPLGTQHRLEAYGTLTFRSVKRCLKKHLREVRDQRQLRRQANVASDIQISWNKG
jgi:hypothetical protein